VRGVDGCRVAEIDAESRPGIVGSGRRDEHLGAGIGRRGEPEDRLFHRHGEAEHVRVEGA
jgi:hypothetical protein